MNSMSRNGSKKNTKNLCQKIRIDIMTTEVYEKIPTCKDDIANPKGQGNYLMLV